jgi:ubiquinone/menaquinone biosynthesis C-methylase UbiE
MNEEHLRLCSSAEWGKYLEETLLPWVTDGTSLGENLLEVGPGPGLTTDLLRQRVKKLTAVEYDPMLASALSSRLAGTNVEVVNADATALPMPDGQYSAAASFTMLHHIPTPELQDKMLAQLARVLKPGGVLVGVDSLDGPDFRKLHEGDICVPINPLTFAERLERAGFTDIDLTVWRIGVKFVARAAHA